MVNKCKEYSCYNKVPNSSHDLCYQCFMDFQDGFINKCSGKNCEYYIFDFKTCWEHKDQSKPTKKYKPQTKTQSKNKLEWSDQWANKGDKFYVYILKLFNQADEFQRYYVGQTDDLLSRMTEHKHNTETQTKGFKKELVYFNSYPSREISVHIEQELKDLNDKNQRAITKLTSEFRIAWSGVNKKF